MYSDKNFKLQLIEASQEVSLQMLDLKLDVRF